MVTSSSWCSCISRPFHNFYNSSSLHRWVGFSEVGSMGICTHSHRHSSHLCPKVCQFTYENTQKYRLSVFFFFLLMILRFLQIEHLCQFCLKQVYWHHFSYRICSLCVSLSYFGISHNISNFLIIIISYGDQ